MSQHMVCKGPSFSIETKYNSEDTYSRHVYASVHLVKLMDQSFVQKNWIKLQ